MATIKSYTDLEQSKKLAEILPHESADMVLLHEEPYETSDSKFDGLHQASCVPFNKYDKSWRQKYKNISYFPCWSLVALLGVASIYCGRLKITLRADKNYNIFAVSGDIVFRSFDDHPNGFDNTVDACYELILKLHELKML